MVKCGARARFRRRDFANGSTSRVGLAASGSVAGFARALGVVVNLYNTHHKLSSIIPPKPASVTIYLDDRRTKAAADCLLAGLMRSDRGRAYVSSCALTLFGTKRHT